MAGVSCSIWRVTRARRRTLPARTGPRGGIEGEAGGLEKGGRRAGEHTQSGLQAGVAQATLSGCGCLQPEAKGDSGSDGDGAASVAQGDERRAASVISQRNTEPRQLGYEQPVGLVAKRLASQRLFEI